MGNSALQLKRSNDGVALATLSLARGDVGNVSVPIILSVLANKVRQSASTVAPGATQTLTSPSITPTAGAPGRFKISAALTVTTTGVPGQIVTFTMLKDGVALAGLPVTPSAVAVLDASNNATGVLEWTDTGPVSGAHTYAILATPQSGTVATTAPQGFILVEETF